MTLNRGLLIAAIAFWVAVELWVLVREFRDVNRNLDRRSRLVIGWGLRLGILAAIVIARGTTFLLPGTALVHEVVGAALVLAGTSLRFWSIHTLGRYFRSVVMVRPGQSVIRSGPYQLVRHPSYTGFLLNLLGLGVALGNWVAMLIIVGAGAATFGYRIYVEEQALSNSMGDEYRRYMAETKRLIPFLL